MTEWPFAALRQRRRRP